MARRPAVTLSAAIVDFIKYRRDDDQVSVKTLTRNLSVLNDLMRYVTQGCPLNEERLTFQGRDGVLDPGPDIVVTSLTVKHISNFRRHRSTVTLPNGERRARAANTVNSDTSTLRCFFKWLAAMDMYRGPNPCVGLRTVRPLRHDFVRIPPNVWPEFFDAAPNPRDRFILVLLFFTMVRGGELSQLTVDDLNVKMGNDRGVRITRTKTKDRDVLPVPSELEQEIVVYLRWYKRLLWEQGITLAGHHKAVPCFGKAMNVNDEKTGRFSKVRRLDPDRTPQRLGDFVTPIMAQMGFKTAKEGAHTARRSGAAAYYYEYVARDEAGLLPAGQIPIQVVSDMLGHASLEQTWHYIGLGQRRQYRNDAVGGSTLFQKTGPAARAKLAVVPQVG